MASQVDVNLSPDNTQQVTVGQNIVQAINDLTQAINETFPNWVTAPANSTASGVAGQVSYDSSYFYVCTASNTWKRASISSW